MTVSDLRVLVENLDEYIHIPGGIERLKKTVLHLAVSGQLVPQDPSEGTGADLYNQISLQNEKNPKKKVSLNEVDEGEARFEIPSSWKWVNLGDLYYTTTGLTYKKEWLDDYSSDSVSVLRGGNISDMRFSAKDDDIRIARKYIRSELYLRRNQLITPAVTSFEHIGKIARIEFDNNETVVGGFVLTLIPYFNDDTFSRYSLLFFSTKEHRDKCRLITNKSGQAFYNLSRVKLLQLTLALPPLNEQKRIVEKVDEIFTLIDELDKKYNTEDAERIKLVKSSLSALSNNGSKIGLENLSNIIKTKADATELRKAILHLAVSGQLVPQDPTEGTGEELYKQVQIEKSALPKKQKKLPDIYDNDKQYSIPASWKWVSLGDSCALKSGNQYKYPSTNETGIPYIKVSDMNLEQNSNEITISSQYYLSSAVKENDLIKEYSIIFPKRGGAIATNKKRVVVKPILVDSNTMAIKPSPMYDFSYFQTWFSGIDISKFGDYSAVPQVNNKDLVVLFIPLPPLAEQKRIVQKTTQLLDLVDELEKLLEN